MAVLLAATAVPFPTCVGMNRPGDFPVQIDVAVPYMRGDEPPLDTDMQRPRNRSLHAWG